MTATTWLTSEWSRRALSRDVAQRTTACFRLPPVAYSCRSKPIDASPCVPATSSCGLVAIR